MKRILAGAVASLTLAALACGVHAQAAKPNQTAGYGEGKVLTFTYTQNYDCVEQPYDDLNFNGVIAARDPSETQTPSARRASRPRSIRPARRVMG